MDIEQRYPW